MKLYYLTCWLAFLSLNPAAVFSQLDPEGNFLLRYMRTQVNASMRSADQTCVLVGTNGHFRLERMHQPPGTEQITTSVFEGVLDQEERQALHKLLNDEKLKQVVSPRDPVTPIIMTQGDDIFLSISREPRPQRLWFYEGDKVLKHESVKPLIVWLRALQKRKLSELKRATPNRCLAIGSSSPVS